MWPNIKQQPLFATLLAILLIGAAAWEVVAIATKMQQYVTLPPSQRQVSVSGTGKVTVPPDIALVNVGMTVEGNDVRSVQEQANQKMSALTAAVKAAGVAAADIQTDEFSINPRYVYEQNMPPRISGYRARQSMQIRIRNLSRINEALAAAGSAGATNIGGLQFTVDDPESALAAARGKAITEARNKALIIAQQLGVHLGRTIAFSESGGGFPSPMALRAYADGMGGGGEITPPKIEQGTNELVSTVTVTYELQ